MSNLVKQWLLEGEHQLFLGKLTAKEKVSCNCFKRVVYKEYFRLFYNIINV